jgi:hypothetical protein
MLKIAAPRVLYTLLAGAPLLTNYHFDIASVIFTLKRSDDVAPHQPCRENSAVRVWL